eukprot:10175396-Alexandrium_andersonii.AAC.1
MPLCSGLSDWRNVLVHFAPEQAVRNTSAPHIAPLTARAQHTPCTSHCAQANGTARTVQVTRWLTD